MLVTRNKIVQTSGTDIKSSKVFEKFTDGTILPVNGAGCQNRINYVLSNHINSSSILQKRLQKCISISNNNNIIENYNILLDYTNTRLLPNEIIVELLNIVNNILSRITIIETNDIVKSLHFYGSKLTKDSKLLSKAIDYVLNNLPNSSNIHFDNLWQVQSWIDPRGFEAKFATFSDKKPFMKIYSYGSKEFGFENVHTYDGDFILRMPKQLRCELQAWYNEDSKDFRKTVIPVLERIFVSSKVKCDTTLDTECDCSLSNLLNALKVSKNRKNIDVSNITLDKSAILHDIEELLNFYITVFHITEAEEARAREYIINNINDDSVTEKRTENDYFK